MKPTKYNYTEHNKIAKSMGWRGKDGIYTTPKGTRVDATASKAGRVEFGYLVARELGHIINN